MYGTKSVWHKNAVYGIEIKTGIRTSTRPEADMRHATPKRDASSRYRVGEEYLSLSLQNALIVHLTSNPPLKNYVFVKPSPRVEPPTGVERAE